MRPFRLEVVAGGVGLVVVSVVMSFAATWCVFSAAHLFLGRPALIVVLALSALSTGITGSKWTRKSRTSTSEVVGVFFLMQLIAVGVCVVLGEGSDLDFAVPVANLFFAPWLLIGYGVGVIADASEHSTFGGHG